MSPRDWSPPTGEGIDDEASFWQGVAVRVNRDLALYERGLLRASMAPEVGDDQKAAHLRIVFSDGAVDLFIEVEPTKPETAVVEAVAGILDSAAFEDDFQPWPPCPAHGGVHSLAPRARGGRAVWVCPDLDREIAEIGALGR